MLVLLHSAVTCSFNPVRSFDAGAGFPVILLTMWHICLTKQEKYYNRKPWILEDDTGEYQYQSQLEASQSATATYYLLIRRGKEFDAVPVGSWYSHSFLLSLVPHFI